MTDNLRYSVNYCVLGYPNATDFEYSPCALDVSCGALEEALTDGILDPAYAEPYSFCDKDGGSILSDKMDACKNCVAGSDSHTYLTNCGLLYAHGFHCPLYETDHS